MNTNEMKATLNMVLARLESDPDSLAEWTVIKKALGQAHKAAGEEVRCRAAVEKRDRKLAADRRAAALEQKEVECVACNTVVATSEAVATPFRCDACLNLIKVAIDATTVATRCAVVLGDEVFEASSMDAARDRFLQWRDDNQLGASDLRPMDGDVYFAGRLMGHVSYNGRAEVK